MFYEPYNFGNAVLQIQRQVVPKGPSEGLLEAGDILIHVNGELVTAFVPLEEVLDASVGEKVSFLVQRSVYLPFFCPGLQALLLLCLLLCRGEKMVDVQVQVQDLHSITPDRFVEVGGGLVHTVSYQMARSFMVPVGKN